MASADDLSRRRNVALNRSFDVLSFDVVSFDELSATGSQEGQDRHYTERVLRANSHQHRTTSPPEYHNGIPINYLPCLDGAMRDLLFIPTNAREAES